MSHFLDRLTFFTKQDEPFSNGHGVLTREPRGWEDGYRKRWQHDKIVRSTHGVNCTGSCSWKIYVKGGIVTWETQQTDYPRTRWDMPNHEPRGCSRGASYSWYLYSANRVKYPLVRGRLLKSWREARLTHDPVEAWASIVESDARRRDYQSVRGMGGFARAVDASVIVRGLRAVSDFDYEFQMAGMNYRLDPDIETVFLMASERHQFISSRFVKEVALLGGDISSFVPPLTMERMLERVAEQGSVLRPG